MTWTMKKPAKGDDAVFFERADLTRSPMLGYVHEVYDNMIEMVIGGQIVQSIRHKDDPGLLTNDNWRRNGCWDFDSKMKKLWQLEEQVADLTARVAKLEGRPSNGHKPVERKPPAMTERRSELLKLAAAHNLTVKERTPIHIIERMLAKAQETA